MVKSTQPGGMSEEKFERSKQVHVTDAEGEDGPGGMSVRVSELGKSAHDPDR